MDSDGTYRLAISAAPRLKPLPALYFRCMASFLGRLVPTRVSNSSLLCAIFSACPVPPTPLAKARPLRPLWLDRSTSPDRLRLDLFAISFARSCQLDRPRYNVPQRCSEKVRILSLFFLLLHCLLRPPFYRSAISSSLLRLCLSFPPSHVSSFHSFHSW